MEGLFDRSIRGRSNFTVIGAYPGGDLAEESILSLVTVLGSSISLVGLVFAFITYSLFSDLRNLSGTALMNLLAALFMTQLLYVVGAGGVQDPELCVGLAFSLQYMRTSVFCWLFLMTLGAFRGFGEDARLSFPADASMRRTFCQYSLFGWCFPIFLLLFSMFLQHEATGDLFAVESLKKANCWFVGRDAFLYGYAAPVLILVLVIASGLTRAALAARQLETAGADGDTRDKTKRKRKLQLCLYVKLTLFLSTATLAALIYELTKLQTFWILYNVCQGVQGIFVALCVTCNCHVLKIYTKSLRKRQKRSRYGGVRREPSKSASLQMLARDPTPEAV